MIRQTKKNLEENLQNDDGWCKEEITNLMRNEINKIRFLRQRQKLRFDNKYLDLCFSNKEKDEQFCLPLISAIKMLNSLFSHGMHFRVKLYFRKWPS